MILSSFSERACAALRAVLPDSAVAYLFERPVAALPRGIGAVHPRGAFASPEAIARFRAEGLIVNVWTVNDGAMARALAEAGADGIITDDVPAVLAALGGVGT